MDMRERHQDLTIITKDVSASTPKTRGRSSPPKNQASAPSRVQTLSLPKSTNKTADANSKFVQSRDAKSSGNKDSQKTITGDKDLDSKLLKSGAVSLTFVTNIDNKKNNAEAKETTVSISKNSTNLNESSQKGKVGNSKSISASKDKASDSKTLQLQVKSSTPKSSSELKESNGFKTEKVGDTPKSPEGKDNLSKIEEQDVKSEETEKVDEDKRDKFPVKKESHINSGVSIQSLTFDYNPESNNIEEITGIRTRLTRSYGKPAPKYPEKPKKGKNAKTKPAEKKEKEEEKEEAPVTRSRRTRSGGPLPSVEEVKKPPSTKSKKAGTSNEKIEMKAKPIAQKRKNIRRLDSQSEDEGAAADVTRKRSLANSETVGDTGGKRRKLRSKRTPDLQLRRSVEEQKLREGRDSSSDEDRCNDIPSRLEDMTDESQQAVNEDASVKGKGKSAVRPHGKGRGHGKGKGALGSRAATDSPAISSDVPSDISHAEPSATPEPTTKSKPSPKKTRRILGLDVGVDIILEETNKESCSGPPVRQSRRIAQIKIKEEAERRKLEEMTLMELKEQQRRRKHDEKNDSKDSMSDKRKRKKKAAESDEDFTVEEEPEEPAMSKKKKKKKKKRKKKSGKGFSDNPWQSTSGSSSSSSLEEEEEQEQTEEEEDESNLVFKSDHEFSPESDLENENGEVQPTRRARTAQKESDGEEVADDHACQKCGKSDHPEWILLCDKCDSGWHGSCLRPALLVIPEGDWFCPPCEHTFLLTNLQDNLREYDKTLKRRENEELRRKRLAYVGISLDNVLPNKEKEAEGSVVESEEEKSSSSESGSSSSEESEPLYHLRERRQTLFSYRFNEYDDLINSAIQDEMEAVKGAGNQGRGKDIATIVNAEKEEMAAAAGINGVGKEGKVKKNEKDADGDDDYQEENEEDEEEDGYIPPVRKFVGRKKHRRLNSLDISSEDDADSDEDFKGSSSEDEEEEEDDLELDDSEDSDMMGRRGRGGRRNKRLEPVRRSTRARITRFDKEFINDDSDESIEPRRKKTRRLWQESDSSESDSTWGRKKKRKYHAESHRPKSKKKKKKKHSKDIDGENSKNKSKNPRIKYGGLDDDDDDDDDDDSSPLPRTRGRKINYQEIAGSESEEELMRAVTKGIESEDEYVASEEEEKMLEDEEEDVEPEAEIEEEDEVDEGETDAELKLKIKSKPQHKQDADTKAKTKEEEEEVEAAAIEAAEEEEKTEVPSEPELPIKEDTDIKDDKVDDDAEDNILPFKAGKKKREKPEKKPKAPRKPREKKPKQEKKPKAERKPKKPRIIRPKKQVIHDDTDDELENFGEEFDDLEEGEIRLGAMLDEREDLMDEELLDEELMDEEKEMEDMLEEELLDEEELDEEDEEDELLAMKEAELALQQAELEKAKEKKRQKREAKKLEKKEQKKRGKRAKKMDDIISSLPINDNAGLEGEQPTDSVQNIMKEIETPPQTVLPIVLPVMSSMSGPVTSPLTPKRRGRGRGKAALAAIADTSSAIGGLVGKLSESGQLGPSLLGGVASPRYPGSNQQQSQPMTFPSQPPHSNSSVISRMLQSQPVSGASQSFTAAAAAMGHKYFGGPGSDQPPLVGPGSVPPGSQNTSLSTRGSGPVGQSYSIPTRGRIPSPYRQPPPLTSSPSGSPGLNMPHYSGMRGSPVRPPPGPHQQTNLSPLRMRTPGPGTQGPQIYHTSHHPLDPSPSGGGPIAIAPNNGVRQGGEGSPLHQPPTQIPPAAGSPLAGKSGPPPSHSTPPPPPYTRTGPLPAMHQQGPPVPPPLIRFPLQSTDIASNGRHPQSPFPPSTTTGNHLQAQPSPPPHQGRSPAPGNFSPYHPPPPPNYHYGAYPPPPPLTAADDALPPSAYQGSPYPDHYASPDATHSLQSDGSNSKSFDEEGGGEFGGLVSYFSSQREDDLDT